jgi:hypothetical protein
MNRKLLRRKSIHNKTWALQSIVNPLKFRSREYFMEQMMGLLLIQFDERNRKNSPERPRESYFVQYGKDQMAASNSWTMQRNQLWITLTLTANQSAADVVFRSASHFDFESLIFHNREPDRWKSTQYGDALSSAWSIRNHYLCPFEITTNNQHAQTTRNNLWNENSNVHWIHLFPIVRYYLLL